MNKYSVILFDLDGTLTDSATGITNSVAYAIEKFGMPPKTQDELRKFIGPPLHESFEVYCNLPKGDGIKMVKVYRERFSDIGIYENAVYDGIIEILQDLRNQGLSIAVATSKPEVYARRIIEHFNLNQYFDYVGGSNLDGTRTVKGDVIEYVLNEMNITDKSSVLMVGDREHDIHGAKANSIDSIGVLYGFSDENEIQDSKPTYIVNTTGELRDFLNSL